MKRTNASRKSTSIVQFCYFLCVYSSTLLSHHSFRSPVSRVFIAVDVTVFQTLSCCCSLSLSLPLPLHLSLWDALSLSLSLSLFLSRSFALKWDTHPIHTELLSKRREIEVNMNVKAAVGKTVDLSIHLSLWNAAYFETDDKQNALTKPCLKRK